MSHSADIPRGRIRPTTWRRALAAAGAVGLLGPPAASALPGLQVAGAKTTGSTAPRQTVTAYCEADEDVVGGGAGVYGSSSRIVAMIPQHIQGGPDSWHVVGETSGLDDTAKWNVFAYAVCAQEWALDDYRLEWASVGSGATFKTTGARCRDGRVAWGSGASVNGTLTGFGYGRVGLQLNRTSGPLDISRASARAENSYEGAFWTLDSIAICADPANFVTAVGQVAPGPKTNVTCEQLPPFYRVHGLGGGGGLIDGGPVWLKEIRPYHDLSGVKVTMSGLLYPSVGGMVANATCAA